MLLGTDFHDKPVDLSVVKVNWCPMYRFRSSFSGVHRGKLHRIMVIWFRIVFVLQEIVNFSHIRRGRVRMGRGRGPSLSVPQSLSHAQSPPLSLFFFQFSRSPGTIAPWPHPSTSPCTGKKTTSVWPGILELYRLVGQQSIHQSIDQSTASSTQTWNMVKVSQFILIFFLGLYRLVGQQSLHQSIDQSTASSTQTWNLAKVSFFFLENHY